MKNKGQTFIKGAMILAIANLIVKIIGAVFKIPLYELIGKDGSGLFNVAYQIYTFMFIIATAGFPTAVSKMVAESEALGKTGDSKKIFRTAFYLLSCIGLTGTVILLLFSNQLAGALGNPDAAMVIRTIAPAVFFVAIVCAFRGYFQGTQNMYPTAFSEVIEALAKLCIGYICAYFVMKMAVNPNTNIIDFTGRTVENSAVKTQYAASGAILGVTAGTILSLLLMLVITLLKKRNANKIKATRTYKDILKELVLIAIPITIGASVSSLTSLVDLATVMNRLVINPEVFDSYSHLFSEGTDFAHKALENGWQGAELLRQKANSLYGMYTGQAQTMFNLPLAIVVAISMSAVPAISGLYAEKRDLEARTTINSVLRITSLFAMPCAIGLSVLSKEILALLYSDSDAYLLLQKLAIAVIFVGIVQVTNGILQASGKVYFPVFTMLIGGIVKVTVNYFGIPIWGIDGAPIATNLCYGVIAVLNIICIVKVLKVKFNPLDIILKPLAAAGIMGVVTAFGYSFIAGIIGAGKIATILAIGIGGVVYLLSIVLLKAVHKEDLLSLPKGEKLAEKLWFIK
ncbi:MAG: polysaccharide biosynthesis protein [Clostridia bacterium]|nr:polysaccharide biosynthesis protein [Clostridia bacterium]